MNSLGTALHFEPLKLPRNQLGESPFWHRELAQLFWCDIKAQKVHAYDPQTEAHRQWLFDSEPGCIAPTSQRDLIVVALRGAVELLNITTGARLKIVDIPHDTAALRSNDGKCDAKGRLWIGTVYEPKTSEAAALWCVQVRDGRYVIEKRVEGNITANGLAFSPDNTRMYWAHTAKHRVDVMDFDLQSGTSSHRREWTSFADKSAPAPYGGRPDGAAVDADGYYWTAMYEGGVLLRLSPEGQVMERHKVPTRYPTMPCFGGADLRTLYLTSASATTSPQDHHEPHSDGMIFTAKTQAQGLPAACFKLLNEA